jgi:hypothetical protein
MAQLVQKTSFSGGEVDPILLERQNIEKVATGLEVARNVLLNKNALLERRKGTQKLIAAKVNVGNVVLVEVPYSNYLLEVSESNVRIIDASNGNAKDIGSPSWICPDSRIPELHFVVSNKYLKVDAGVYTPQDSKCVYIFAKGVATGVIIINESILANSTYQNAQFTITTAPYIDAGTPVTFTATGSFTGAPRVEYLITVVKPNGEETLGYSFNQFGVGPTDCKLPVVLGEQNKIVYDTDNASGTYQQPLEMKVYRKPYEGGAYGYIGSSFKWTQGGSDPNYFYTSTFVDFGQIPDYSNNPPTYIIPTTTDLGGMNAKTGAIIQGRMFLGNVTNNVEAVYGSRTNYVWNFTRDYPLSEDSAMALKSGQSGAAQVLRIADAGTLVVFTSVGIYAVQQRGAITPYNSALSFVSSVVINPNVAPVKMGEMLFFVDGYDNSVKGMDFSNLKQNYSTNDFGIYSNHLFKDKEIISWAVHAGNTSSLWVVLDDGSVLSMQYNPSQELLAWTRQDFFEGKAVAVCNQGIGADAKLVFSVERNGVRTLEYLSDEYMDSYVSKSINMAASLAYPLKELAWFFTALGPDGFAGDIRLDTTNPTTYYGTGFAVGKIYRMFDSNGDAYDIECTSIPSDHQVVFKIYQTSYEELPVELRTDPNIWETFTTVTNLAHLNGKDVSVTVDGTTVASPLNNDLDLPYLSPTSGSLTVPRAAFATVGLPYVSDIGTTDVKSPQNAKVALSSRLGGKVYTKTDNASKLFYVGAYFPEDDTVTNMKRSEEMFVNINERNQKVRTHETVVPADWNNGARSCIRVVDPVPFRLLSITTAVNIS